MFSTNDGVPTRTGGMAAGAPPTVGGRRALGGGGERANAPVLKAGVRSRGPRVRTPPPPLSLRPAAIWLYGATWDCSAAPESLRVSRGTGGARRRPLRGHPLVRGGRWRARVGSARRG